MKLDENIKKELIDQLLPLVRERNSLSCFGFTWTSDMTICRCSGSDQSAHMQKQSRRMELEEKIVKIVEEKIGKPVFIMPSTYTDMMITLRGSEKKIPNGYSFEGVLTLDSNGEVTTERTWI